MSKKVAFLTNATEYVGPPTQEALIEKGWTVFCHDDTFFQGETRASFEQAKVERYACAQIDVAAFVEEGVSRFGRIDALISNDIPKRAPVAGVTDPLDGFEHLVDSLLLEPVRLLRAALPAMRSAGTGSIVLVTSGAPLRNPIIIGGAHGYVAGRAGTNALAKALSVELAASGIQVNAVAPFFVYSKTFFPSDIGPDDPQYAPIVEQVIPMKQFGSPEGIGKLISLLATGEAGFVSGQVVAYSGAGC